MGAEEEASAVATVPVERVPPSSQTSFDPSAQQRWNEMETIHLITAYQEKWYLLKRGQLKARHWEEVANNVFLRGGGTEPSKSSVQCRHKIEKLRKKYREEKQLEEQRGPGSSTWPYFERMDAMEHGSVNTKVNPSATLANATTIGNGNTARNTRFRLRWQDRSTRDHESAMSLNNDMQDMSSPPITRMRGSLHKGGLFPDSGHHPRMDSSYSNLHPKLHKSHGGKDDTYLNMDGRASIPDLSSDQFSKRLKTELASVVRSLGEGFLRIEQMKLEMQRDNERLRAEVELKRTGMLLDSQKQIAEMFTKALTGKKGVKKRQLQEL